MVNETGVDDGSLGSETWLDRLIATAGRDPSWKSSSTLLTLARALSRREALDAMEDDEAMAYCVKLDKLAAMFEPDEGKCGAFTLAGQRCESRARGALTCQNRRHKTQGMWSLARNEDGIAGHPSEFICYGCHEDSDNHADPGDYLACLTCTACLNRSCAMDLNGGGDIPEEAHWQCSWCAISRHHLPLFLGAASREGQPVMPEIVVLPRLAGVPSGTAAGNSAGAPDGVPSSSLKESGGGGDAGTEHRGSGAMPDTTREAGRGREHADTTTNNVTGGGPGATVRQDSRLEARIASLTEIVASMQSQMARVLQSTGAPSTTPDRRDTRPAGADLPSSLPPGLSGPFQVPLAEFSGPKGTDGQGRGTQDSQHFLHSMFAMHFDLMALSTERESRKFRVNMGYVEPAVDDVPQHVHLVRYWKGVLDFLWRMLHVDSGDFSPATAAGLARRKRVATIITRIKWLFAVVESLQLRHVPGEPALSWEVIYAYVVRLYHTDLEGQDVPPVFDQFWGPMVARLTELLDQGVKPHLHDEMQEQLRCAARGRLNHSWIHELAQDFGLPATRKTKSKRCLLCHGTDHSMTDHGSRPITIPCPRCGNLHALSGPLKTACPK